jgi:hypothetical protein
MHAIIIVVFHARSLINLRSPVRGLLGRGCEKHSKAVLNSRMN